jgi:hypothetical protein
MIILLLSVVGVVTVMFVHGCAPTLTGLKHCDGSAGAVSLTPAERKIAWQKMKKRRSIHRQWFENGKTDSANRQLVETRGAMPVAISE